MRKLIYMHDNAPFHAAKATTQYLECLSFKNQTLMTWPLNSPDLNPTENLWSVIKRRVYANERQYTSKEALWQALKQNAGSIPRWLIGELTDSVNE